MELLELRHRGLRLVWSVLGQPVLQEGDFGLLCANDLFGQGTNVRIVTMLQGNAGHFDGALMVWDHAAGKVEVGVTTELDVHLLVHALVGL